MMLRNFSSFECVPQDIPLSLRILPLIVDRVEFWNHLKKEKQTEIKE